MFDSLSVTIVAITPTPSPSPSPLPASDTPGLVPTLLAPVVVASLISLVGVLLTKLYADRRLEELKGQIARDSIERQAILDYEYDARKRLYADLQPMFFQVKYRAADAQKAVRAVSLHARNEEPLDTLADLALESVYKLMAPQVLIRLVEDRLTELDVSVDASIARKYRILCVLRDIWTADPELLQQPPRLAYNPSPRSSGSWERSINEKQDFNASEIEDIVEQMKVVDQDGRVRCLTLGEFRRSLGIPGSLLLPMITPMQMALLSLTPIDYPVLWRLIMAQGVLYTELAEDRDGSAISERSTQSVAAWFSDGNESEPAPQPALWAAAAYLHRRLPQGTAP